MSIFSIIRDAFTVISVVGFVYAVINEIRALILAKRAGSSDKTLLAAFFSWIKSFFLPVKPIA